MFKKTGPHFYGVGEKRAKDVWSTLISLSEIKLKSKTLPYTGGCEVEGVRKEVKGRCDFWSRKVHHRLPHFLDSDVVGPNTKHKPSVSSILFSVLTV